MGSDKKLILIVVDGFPKLSETFILNHIVTLRELGYRIKIMANRKVGPPYHPLVKEYGILDDLTVRPRIPLKRMVRLCVFIQYFFKSVLLDPVAVFRSFNASKYSKSATNGELVISLYNYLKIEKPALIHCHFGQNGALAEKVLDVLRWKIPLYVTFHGYDTNPADFVGINYSRLADRAKAIFVNSAYLKSRVIALGFKKEKIHIIPVGLLSLQKKTARKSLKGGKFTCLAVARLVEVKGIEYCLKALSLFYQAYPKEEFTYIIVGDGMLRESLGKLVISLGLEESIVFAGALSQDKVQEYYQRASLFMLTGITTESGIAETQGLVFQEAASFGLPILASDAGGVKEYVIHEETGLIAEEKNVKDIYAKFCRLYFDPELRKKLGAAAKQKSANFNQFDFTKKMIAIYESDQKN